MPAWFVDRLFFVELVAEPVGRSLQLQRQSTVGRAPSRK
jgi:hypothetical protein